jgi:hypothetical protein
VRERWVIEGKLEHKFPEDSSAQAIQTLFKRIKLLETEIESLKSGANLSLPQAEKASIDNF